MQTLYTFQRRIGSSLRSFFWPSDIPQRNIRNVLIDGFGVGLVNGVATFLSIFLVRLNASSLMVGLLTSLPALAGMVLTIFIGQLLERQRNIVPWYSASRVLVFLSYALMGVAPFFFPLDMIPIVIIILWAFATVPQIVLNVAFTVVMGAVAGPDKRYYLMSRRWSILGASTAISVALCGWLLDTITFPLNYQIVFIASFAAGLLSFAFSRQISIPDNEPVAKPQGGRRSPRQHLNDTLALLRGNGSYNRFIGSQFLFRLGLGIGIPLFPIYWVRDLQASDSWVGIINTVSNAVLLIAYFIWSSVSERRGPGIVLRICVFGMALYPLVTGLTHTTGPLPLYAGVANLFSAGIDLVLFDILLSTCPKSHTATYVALYQMTNSVATFFGPMIGTTIGDMFGYSAALIFAALVRFAGLGLFVLFQVGNEPKPEPSAA
ncbi:MFS transporter [Chloroflexia bacterium SDU3-3]|nr:MFS transporter [Chloroflexia bacterium SDU3-3]